jgi:hypothetical protein
MDGRLPTAYHETALIEIDAASGEWHNFSMSDNATYQDLEALSAQNLNQLLQLRVLRLGVHQDGDVRIGVFP